MLETALQVGCLAGALTEPEGAGTPPIVLMLHGSGGVDRNENTRAQKLDIFNTFAEFLARRGVASLRYDKRGCGQSGGEFLAADQTDFVEDAKAWLDAVQERFPGRFSRRFLLGHSEGTVVAARLSLLRDVDGLVLLCPYLQDMETILISQAEQLDQALDEATGVSGAAQRAIAGVIGRPSAWQARLIRRIRTSRKPTIRFAGRRLPAKWLRECLDLDLAKVFSEVSTPTLLVGGGKDIQCDPEDAVQIGKILGDTAQCRILPDMTHILRMDPDPPSFNTYKRQMSRPVAPELLQTVGDWLDGQAATRDG